MPSVKKAWMYRAVVALGLFSRDRSRGSRIRRYEIELEQKNIQNFMFIMKKYLTNKNFGSILIIDRASTDQKGTRK